MSEYGYSIRTDVWGEKRSFYVDYLIEGSIFNSKEFESYERCESEARCFVARMHAQDRKQCYYGCADKHVIESELANIRESLNIIEEAING